MSDSNRRRALAEVVNAEAWHQAFAEGRARTDLHVDVVFGIGRIGGGDPSGVRFRLALKRAELVVIVPDVEPVKVDPSSVRRDAPKEVLGKIETKAKVSKTLGIGASVNGGVDAKGVKGKAEARASASLDASKNKTVTATQTFKGMTVTQNRTADDHLRWVIEPSLGARVLDGRPWDAEKIRRLQLIDQRPQGSKSLSPVVRIEVRCLREDLAITDIKLDNEIAWAKVRRRKAAQNRMVAAEGAIRTLLSQEGLVVGDMADPYAQLTLAMTTADAV